MNRAKKSRKNLSWQAARQKIINHVLAKKANYSTHSPLQNVTNVFGKEICALDQYGWVSPAAQPDTILSVIRQMVDIMDKLGCNDLKDVVHQYMNML